MYVGTQESDDPLSGKMFRMFIALNSEERGIAVKLPGEIRIPPNGGPIETTFDNNPQVPVSQISLKLKGGPRAPLATPLDCGHEDRDGRSSRRGPGRSSTRGAAI